MSRFPSDVSIAIIAHDNRDELPATLASLDAAGCPHGAIHVMDVASTDGTSEWLGITYPDVRVTRLPKNEGPNPGRNLGVRESPHPYVFLMDADVQVQPETVQCLRAAMAEDPNVKIGSSIVVDRSAHERIQYAGTSLHFICEAINPWVNRTLAERGPAAQDIGVATACGLLLDRQAAIDVGLFDERYFMGKDDGDFTHRTRIAGFRILEVPQALVLHHSRPRGTWLFYYQIRNRWHFMLKNYQWRTLILILPCLLIHEPLQLVVLHLKGHGGAYWKAVAGLVAMLPALGRDRAMVGRFRTMPDAALLKSDSLVIRDDLTGNPLARAGKRAYEGFLRAYWLFLTRTGLVA